MMSKPFFNENYPSYVQMANLGHIIAHEIWHHFDTAGIKYDAKGSKKSILSQPSKKNMDSLSECIAQQYSTEYEGFEDGLKYTFKNLCSKSSVNDYTLSIFENEHLPSFRRVNDIALNSPEFRKAFSCSIKAPCKFFT
ncbi:hypothetical protein J437_LFUL002391 [Ladona fulva]|uniref:Peptidase M13 C-terminal domain-containing protein n=1 Tax=Ladona fulva TaxID=123851 RepID=A0A8K0K4F8_LADFU|nr:hypothetical protein J437_LFUL002391 [Ladona fulva]